MYLQEAVWLVAAGLLPFLDWYPVLKDGLHWWLGRFMLMGAHDHQSVECSPCAKHHIIISGILKSLLLWSAMRWSTGLGIRLSQVYNPTLTRTWNSLRLWDSISQTFNVSTKIQLPGDYQQSKNMVFLVIKNQNSESHWHENKSPLGIN